MRQLFLSQFAFGGLAPAVGFHQPPTYYVERWRLTGAEVGPQPAGRFRPEVPGQQVVGEWSWYENPFVGSHRSRITFDYRGIYRDVIDSVTPTDVRWACQLLSRLSERQWREAFRAAQYSEQHATRYINKIKQKVAQGLALTALPAS